MDGYNENARTIISLRAFTSCISEMLLMLGKWLSLMIKNDSYQK